MLPTTRLKNLYEGPLPPMALTDYEAMSKFLNQGAQRCKVSGRNFDLFLDWVIHALTMSLTSDSAARMFLPKTKTGPFVLDDLIPLSGLAPSGKKRVRLSECSLIAPVWNNGSLEAALESLYDSGFAGLDVEEPFGGAYFPELRLAVVDSPADVALPSRAPHRWGSLVPAGGGGRTGRTRAGAPDGGAVQLRPAALLRKVLTAEAAGEQAADLLGVVLQLPPQRLLHLRVPEADGQQHPHIQRALFLQQAVQRDAPALKLLFLHVFLPVRRGSAGEP